MTVRFYDVDGNSHSPFNHKLTERGLTVFETIWMMQVRPESCFTICFINSVELHIQYEQADGSEKVTTFAIQCVNEKEPCEELLSEADQLRKYQAGAPEDGCLCKVSIERLMTYIESVAKFAAHKQL